jgi:hypothetical protein
LPGRERLFVEHLPAAVFAEADPVGLASQWVSESLLSQAQAVRDALAEAQRVPHVFVTRALRPHVARGLTSALARARFQRHHHAPYPLDIAPATVRQPPELASLVAWLGSPQGAAFHAWLAGWTGTLTQTQVQVSRMRVGQSFPLHFDTTDDGVAVLYYLSRGWRESYGGVLEFPRDDGAVELRVPPLENSLFLFRPREAAHAVTPVRARRWSRYAVATFYLASGR